MAIECVENEDGSFTLSWDPNDPVESVLNDWTEETFINCIMDYANKVLGEE
jgi:hypothetical protein